MNCWLLFLRHTPGRKVWLVTHGWTECSACGTKFRHRTTSMGPI